MRSGKRLLAGVAAGALGAGMMVGLAAAPAANAASLTGTVSPVRVSYTGTTLDTVPYAKISWTTSAAIGTSDTAVVTLTSAPDALSRIGFGTSTNIGAASQTTPGTLDTGVGIATLATSPKALTAFASTAVNSGETASIGVAATVAGTYKGSISIRKNSDGSVIDTVAFSFTTVGAPKSMTLSPASQTTAISGTANVLVSLLDASGNPTQPQTVDDVDMTASAGSVTDVVPTGAGTNSLYDGSAVAVYTAPGTAGSNTITATPLGTLPTAGVTTQNATVIVSGSISIIAVTSIEIGTPSNAVNAGTNPTAATAAVPTGTSKIGVDVVGTASTTIRLKAVASAGTVNGTAYTTPVYTDVALDSDGEGSAEFTLAGNALAANATLTVTQVNSANSGIGGVSEVVTQTAPAVTAASITLAPTGSIVQKLGTDTAVTVTVEDQFGTAIPNAAVSAYRTNTSGALLGTATTDASGNAVVTVMGASGITAGTVETYAFQATPPAGTPVTASATLVVTYTADGAVTSMSVAVGTSGATSPILNTTTEIPVLPYATVPYDGAVDVAVTQTYTVATGATTGATNGEYVVFTPAPSPANTVTVTVPEGVKVATSLSSLKWNGGSQSVNAASGQAVYVFATKTGDHDVTFTSGAISVTAKIKVKTAPAAAYNIAMEPATQQLAAGSFGTAKVTVTDVFGNPVPGATGTATGGVTVAATGEVLVGGLQQSTNVTTGTDGTATVTLIAGKPGTGSLTASPQAPTTTSAWVAGYVPPTGAPAPVTSAAATVTITDAPSTKSITITGERGTVKGKPGIMVDGVTTGFDKGTKMVPHIKFPGQSSYSEGSARPTTDEMGEFYWQRKTGKKIYIYFTNEDGDVKSNRIIIQAK